MLAITRVWIHTHPGSSAQPSRVDEETFARVFGRSDWAVMAILAQGGQTYARLQFAAGPGGSLRIPVKVDFSSPFGGSDWQAWEREYADTVRSELHFQEWFAKAAPSHRDAAGLDSFLIPPEGRS